MKNITTKIQMHFQPTASRKRCAICENFETGNQRICLPLTHHQNREIGVTWRLFEQNAVPLKFYDRTASISLRQNEVFFACICQPLK